MAQLSCKMRIGCKYKETLKFLTSPSQISATMVIDSTGWTCNNAASALQDVAELLYTIQLVC